MYRTNTCNELTKKDIKKEVVLSGWVNSRRDHGGLIFIDLRDRYGLTQITFDPKVSEAAWKIADLVRDEFVIKVAGKVIPRPDDMINKKLATGEIEIEATEIEILNKSKTPPFELAYIPGETEEEDIDKSEKVSEDLRLTYRYLDIRRRKMVRNLEFRAKFIKYIRDFLHRENFVEVETPILTKSSPEGARDFLVPSRLHPGKFYALPQSPQQYKQLMMVGGLDKYFQIAPCMRDEDARADRSPGEFYQLDLEMSFVEQGDVLDLMERLFTSAVEKLSNKKVMQKPWPRLTYDEALLKYGVDKPDLRFGLEIEDLTEMVKDCGFEVFSKAVKNRGVVRALNAKGGAKLTRSEIDKLTDFVRGHGAKGLAYIVIEGKGKYRSPIIKFLGDDLTGGIIEKLKGQPGDIIFFGADKELVVCEALGQLRNELAKAFNLVDKNTLAFCFVVDFPVFEPEMVEGHYAPMHHMFTMPKEEDWAKLTMEKAGEAKSYQHDMVLNGFEVGGGSIRIHRPDIQEKIFKLIGFKDEQIKYFSHMLEAFKYGAPPHGGMAPGIERLVMLLLGENNIREVTAFPKNSAAQDLMMGAPSKVDKKQLDEIGVRLLDS